MFLYIRYQNVCPSSEDNVRSYLLRLSRRWCLTSVDCTESRINRALKQEKNETLSLESQVFQRDPLGC